MDKLKLHQKINRCEIFSCLMEDEREEYIKNCSDKCIHSLSEVYYNVLTGGLYISPRKIKKVNENLIPINHTLVNLLIQSLVLKKKGNYYPNHSLEMEYFLS